MSRPIAAHTLKLIKRHGGPCKLEKKDRKPDNFNCDCNFSSSGFRMGEELRKNTGTNVRSKAEAILKDWIKNGWHGKAAKPGEKEKHEIDAIVAKFLTEHAPSKSGMNCSKETVGQYRTHLGKLQAWAKSEGIIHVEDLNEDLVAAWRKRDWAAWNLLPQTVNTYVTSYKVFGDYCLEFCKPDFAAKLEYMDVEKIAHPGLSQDRLDLLIQAAGLLKLGRHEVTVFAIVTFLMVMRETGFAMCDAVMLQIDSVDGNMVSIFRRKVSKNKTRIPVDKPISDELRDRLAVLAKDAYLGRYYFARARNGKEPNLRAVESCWRGYLTPAFQAAGCEGVCRTHRIRHAHGELLLGSVVEIDAGKWGFFPLQDVATQMGHKNTKMIEEHYPEQIKKQRDRSVDFARQVAAQQEARKQSLPRVGVDAQLTMDELAS